MKRNVILSDSREVPLLLFLWKWKVVTTAALTLKFFQECSGKTAYNRLLSLRHAGLIQIRSDGPGQKFVYALERKGFDAIGEHLPPLKEKGYKSEQIGHDLVVSAFHLGDWLLDTPEAATLFSEQQLRRIYPDMYPDWVPRSEIHRPDGYTRILIGDHPATVAIEVELSAKRNADYLKIAEFYSYYQTIARVLWLVPRRSMAVSIQERLNKSHNSNISPHNFIMLEDFQKLGWHAGIEFGQDQGKSVMTLLAGKLPEKPTISAGVVPSLALLDTRKSPHTSRVYRPYQFGDFRD